MSISNYLRTPFLVLASVAAALLVAPHSASAYETTCTDNDTITYLFSNGTADIAGDAERQAVLDGMGIWSRVADVTFRQAAPFETLDTTIAWSTGSHGDGHSFDGAGGVLAHAFAPCAPAHDGDIHFDDAETWTTGAGVPFGQPVDLVTVAAHEAGHALGLAHEPDDPTTLMNEFYNPTRRYLSWDDIAGVQQLYGRGNGVYHLRNANSDGPPHSSFLYQNLGDRPVAGDWNGDGRDTVGTYRPGNNQFYLMNTNSTGHADYNFAYGGAGYRPIAGDWNNDGIDSTGHFRPSSASFILKNANTGGSSDYVFSYGATDDIPVAGDWNGDGTDTIGVFRPSTATFHLRNSNSAGAVDYTAAFGMVGDVPVVGDWNNDGVDSIGVYRPSLGMFYLRNSNSAGSADYAIAYGRSFNTGAVVANGLPVAGDWDNDGAPTIGLYQN